MSEQRVCRWIEQGEIGLWQTACGESHWFPVTSPSEERMAFCCYCGGVLEEVAAVDPDADESEPVRT